MPDLMRLRGRTALITGAGSGIGAALAQALGRKGCHLALADIRPDDLARTRQAITDELGNASPSITLHELDVGDAAQVAALPEEIARSHARLDLLVNNAGVAIGGTFEQTAAADFEWLLNINLLGVIRMTRAFLPVLHRSDDARLVNVSSLFGLIAPPGQTAYSAAKFGVRGFSNALARELVGSTVGVTVVHPGGIRTRIAERAKLPDGVDPDVAATQRARFNKHLRMDPAQAAEIILHAVEHRKTRVLVGNDAKLLSLVERLLPVSYPAIIERLTR